ncbi:MAG: glycosyl transferase family 2, partial [uncultured bacterium]
MEPKNIKLSVALAVYNEESNIADCLESIKGIASEIIVVDGESSDRTAQIAKHLGATVISTPNLSNFHINKQKAIDACTGDWILQLDADERVSSMLAKEIKKIIETDL